MIYFFELIKEKDLKPKLNIEKTYKINISNNPSIDEVQSCLKKCIKIEKKFCENVYIASFDSDGSLIGFHHISIGNKRNSEINLDIILTHLLLVGAFSFIVIHNHSNNHMEISQNDIDSFNTISTFSDIINIICVDSIIITEAGWVSIKTGEKYYEKNIF